MSNSEEIPSLSQTVPSLNDSNKLTDSSYEQDLRRSIISIHNDSTLTPAQRAQRIQGLMHPNKNNSACLKLDEPRVSRKQQEPTDSTDDLSILQCLDFLDELDLVEIEIESEALEKSFNEVSGIVSKTEFGCKHYKTNCKFMAECCKKWYPCRFCHNEEADHEVNRFKTKFCLCMNCNTVQRASKTCINSNCGKDLANYYCDFCKFWDNDPNKHIFHCDKCKVCRSGLKENFIHCDKCNACLTSEYYEDHKCIERSLECDCPICGEFLFTTTAPIIFMPCGHGIHFFCHRDHLQSSYQCPICLKSVTDMSHFFNQIDLMLTNHQMPPEYSEIKSLVLCNDCEQKSTAEFHFVYHKCGFCKSYNTKLLKTFNEDELEAEEDDEIPPPEDYDSNNLKKGADTPNLEK